MTSKTKMRARLLKLYKQTGDEEYRAAAEALKVPLLDHLKQLEIYSPRRRGRTVGKEVGARLYRMHKLVAGGMAVSAAAEQEVEEHGHRFYVTKKSEIDFLRKEYAARRELISQDIALAELWAKPARQMLVH